MALPNSNISVAMVKAELAAATNNVGELCRHPNINKWSKWKPVRHNSLTPITQAQLESPLVNFGLKPPDPSTDYTTVMDEKWEYLKPTGGLLSPYRLTDFINYDKSAGAIAYVEEKIHINKTTTTSREIILGRNIAGTDFLIGLDDFIGYIGNYYYGAVIEERTNRFIITSDKTMANSGFSFTLDFTQAPFNLLWQDYTIRHLLISKSSPTIQTLGNFGAASFMSIPTADGDVNFTEMTVSTRPPSGDLVVNFTHVGTGTLPQYPISNYRSIDGASLQTSGDLYFRVNLVNFSNSSKLFQYPDEIVIAPTFFGDTYRGPIEIYYQGVLKTDAQISVPASTTIELVMGNINLINRQNSSVTMPPPGVNIFPNISIYRYGYRLTGFSLKLNS